MPCRSMLLAMPPPPSLQSTDMFKMNKHLSKHCFTEGEGRSAGVVVGWGGVGW